MPDGLSYKCKDCVRSYNQKWFPKWLAKNRTRLNWYVNNHRKRVRTWIIEQLGSKCFNCGYDKNHIVFEVHRENGHKKQIHAEHREWYSTKRIPNDVRLLCANCHRIVHR